MRETRVASFRKSLDLAVTQWNKTERIELVILYGG